MYTKNAITVIRELTKTAMGFAESLPDLSDDQKKALECISLLRDHCNHPPEESAWQFVWTTGGVLSMCNTILDYTKDSDLNESIVEGGNDED